MNRISFLKKKYKNIPLDVFNLLVDADPTKEKKFLEWLCRVYNKKNLSLNSLSSIYALLETFNKIKSSISSNNRDINNYKTPVCLSFAITSFYKNQQIDAERYLKSGAIKIFEDDNWLVIKPETFQASVKYGKNTVWCTSSNWDSSHFHNYKGSGELFIFINKLLPQNKTLAKSKYLIHFEKDNKYVEFRNARNTSVDFLKFFLENKALGNLIISNKLISDDIIPKTYSIPLKINNDIEITEYEQLIFIEDNCDNIKHLKNPCNKAQVLSVKNNPCNIQHIDSPCEEAQITAVNKNQSLFWEINNPCEKTIIEYVRHNGINIRFLQKKEVKINRKIENIAIDSNPNAIKYISNPTKTMKIKALIYNIKNLKYINVNLSQVDLLRIAKKNLDIFNVMKISFSKKEWEELITKNPYAIQYMENPNGKLQIIAIKKDYNLIKKIKNPTKEAISTAEKMKKTKEIKNKSVKKLKNKYENWYKDLFEVQKFIQNSFEEKYLNDTIFDTDFSEIYKK